MRLSSLFILIFGSKLCLSSSLEEPFLLPFGPEHGDTFNTKSLAGCSAQQNLSYSFQFGQANYSKLFVCMNGYMSLDQSVIKYDPDDMDDSTVPLIVPFFSLMQTNDNFYDRMCEFEDHYVDNYFELVCSLRNKWNQNGTNESFSLSFNQYFVTDFDIRNSVTSWVEKTFYNSVFDLQYDDEVALKVFGEDTTKYVNLANNILKREMNESDRRITQALVRRSIPDFQAEWGYVATWYKVGRYSNRIDAFNSFQVMIVCGSALGYKRCFSIFDFFELQWASYWWQVNFARSGFVDGHGSVIDLPFSGTAEVENLWAYSNIDHDEHYGIWIFELNQVPNDGRPFVFTAHKSVAGGSDLATINCFGPIEPEIANKSVRTKFSISNCYLPKNSKIKLEIDGTSECGLLQEYVVTHNPENSSVQAEISWHSPGPSSISINIDGITIPGHFPVFFVEPSTLDSIDEISISADELMQVITLDFSQCRSTNRNVTGTFIKDQPGTEVSVTTIKLEIPEDSNIVTHEIEDDGFGGTIQFRTDDGRCYSIPIERQRDTSASSCTDWDRSESENDYTVCEKEIAKWHGCPRQTNGSQIMANDSFWADLEASGQLMNGWEYDICCGKNQDEIREKLNLVHYCSKQECTYNPGADFCIRSPRLACRATIGGKKKPLLVSNQCCYASGTLLTDANPYSAGRMHLEVNSMDNLPGHYWNDLYPYSQCCTGTPPNSAKCLDIFKKHRKTIIGNYMPRNFRINRGDPDIQTVDGRSYPFMGIGVYTMIKTWHENPTIIQASMRKMERGTVFSGIVAKHKNSNFQCHIHENGNFILAVNGQIRERGLLNEYILGDILVQEQNSQNIVITFLDTNLVVRVTVVNNLLNLMIAVPPSFKFNSTGLMGFFDGDMHNDFQAFNGTTYDPETDLQILHWHFGESWKVSRGDWLFSVPEIRVLIEREIERSSNFEPSYEIEFADENLEQQATQVCKNDSACIRDVSLVGDIGIADAFLVIEENILSAEISSEIYDINEKFFFEEITVVPEEQTTSPELKPNTSNNNNKDESRPWIFIIIALICFFIAVIVIITLIGFRYLKPVNKFELPKTPADACLNDVSSER